MLKQPFILKPSYLLASFLLLIHLGAILAIISASAVWFITLTISILVVCSFCSNLRCYALQLSPKSIVKISRKPEEWLLYDKQGRQWPAKLTAHNFRSQYLVILNFKLLDKKSKVSVIILPDSLNKNDFRRLRAQLLIERHN